MKSFPTIPVESVKSLPNNTKTNESNHLQTDVDGVTNYLRSMTMNEIAVEQHSYSNQSYLLDQTIDKAAELLTKSAEPFKDKIYNFVATQAEIDAMISNIPTLKSKTE